MPQSRSQVYLHQRNRFRLNFAICFQNTELNWTNAMFGIDDSDWDTLSGCIVMESADQGFTEYGSPLATLGMPLWGEENAEIDITKKEESVGDITLFYASTH